MSRETAIIQLPSSARLSHSPPIHKPRAPAGPGTSTRLLIHGLSEAQLQA